MSTYSGASLILGTGTVSGEAIDAWLAKVGPAYAVYVDLPYKPAPPVGHAILDIAKLWGINWDLMAAQIVHESAAWQSAIARDKNNPSGLGAENDNPYGKAVAFDTPALGIRATAAHLMTYCKGDGPWAASDPRFSAVPLAWRGSVKVLDDLNGKWAWPGTTYGSSIAGLANDLVRFANDQVWQPKLQPPAGWTPPAIIRRILPRDASNTPQVTMDWDYLTVHNTGNTDPTANALAHADWLEKLARERFDEPSWGYTVDDTRIVQHLEDDQCGWHASDGDGPGNLDSIGVELVEIGDQEKVLWNAAWLLAEKLRARGRGVERIRQHYDWARDKKNCPRLLRANNGAGWQRLLGAVAFFLTADRPQIPPAQPDPWRDFGGGNPYSRDIWVLNAFVEWINRHGGFWAMGYPMTPAFIPHDRTVLTQFFEGGALEWHPENADPAYHVLRRHCGAEVLRATYPEMAP